MKHYAWYNILDASPWQITKCRKKPLQQSLQLLFNEDKLTAGASVLVGGDVGCDGVD